MVKAPDFGLPDLSLSDGSRRLWLLLKTDTKTSSMEIMGRLAGLPGVRKVHMTEGEWSFVLEVSGKPERAREVASRVSRIPGVKETKGVVEAL